MHKLSQKIAAEIAATGVMPFSRFMDLALYCPECGFYEREEDRIGKTGEFITSVSVGSLFGHLLAERFADWLEGQIPGSNPAKIAEAGAHNAAFARDLLEWLSLHRPELFARLEYWLIEPSSRRREWQTRRLSEFTPKARWVPDLEALGREHRGGFEGIVFANEFLDALPVQRLQWDAVRRSWFECGVQGENGRFAWQPLARPISPDNHPLLSRLPAELLEVLPNAFTTEFGPAALRWWSTASRLLRRGVLVGIDYGLSTEEFFLPHRHEGTLRGYRFHQVTSHVLANPGEQDITAHVDFSLLKDAGEQAGLRTEALVSQSRFLTGIVQKACERAAQGASDAFADWNEAQKRQFRMLTNFEGLGRFTVLVQTAAV